jgi:hypothetical protein
MSNWYVIAVVGLAAIGILCLLYRGDRDARSREDRQDRPRPRPGSVMDREAPRLTQISAEDGVLEMASWQRDAVPVERIR